MSLLDRQQRPRRAEVKRRRPGGRRRRRFAWLAFWLRKNRRTGEARQKEGAVTEAQEAGDTLRAGDAPSPVQVPPGSAGRPVAQALLRLAGVLGVAGLVFGAGIGGVHLLRSSRHFALRNIEIGATAHVTKDALVARSGLQLGDNLFQLDLGRAQRELAAEPWLRRVRVRRQLPATVHIDVEEQAPRALVALGGLYLCDGDGAVFKRATPEEAKGLPVITGVGREGYVADRGESQALIREALQALDAFRAGAGRPPIGEVHVDPFAGPTLYTDGGVAIRIGPGGPETLPSRLQNFDAVWAELQRRGERPAVVFLDNRAHVDHVTVRLEPASRAGSGTPQ